MSQSNTKQPLDFDGDRWPLSDSAFTLASIHRRKRDRHPSVGKLVDWRNSYRMVTLRYRLVWKSLMLCIIKREEWPIRTYGGIVFLTHDLVLLPNTTAKAFEVVQLPDLTKADDTSVSTFKRIARLHIPRMREHCVILEAFCWVSPNPPCASHHNSRVDLVWQKARERPFFADASRALVSVQFAMQDTNAMSLAERGCWIGNWDRLDLLVPRHVLVEAIRSHVRHDGKSHGEARTTAEDEYMEEDPTMVDVPWKLWGPGNVRWHRSYGITVRRPAMISGQRTIGFDVHRDSVVKDFNPYAVKRMCAALKAAQPREEEELWLDDFPHAQLRESHYSSDLDQKYLHRIFSDHVELNELPYVETVMDISDMCIEFEEGALTDEERIIGLKVSRFSLSFRNLEQRSKV